MESIESPYILVCDMATITVVKKYVLQSLLLEAILTNEDIEILCKGKLMSECFIVKYIKHYYCFQQEVIVQYNCI